MRKLRQLKNILFLIFVGYTYLDREIFALVRRYDKIARNVHSVP